MSNKWIRLFILVLIPCSLLFAPSCNPEAKWETEDVDIQMTITTVSAGFIECSFSTDKDAYYLIAIEPVQEGFNPMEHQKQFMTLALDSAYAEYLLWRSRLLKEDEFNIAPFASHSLHYGSVDYFFTGLMYDTEYWVYAFVVNPKTLQPSGKLHIERIKTTYYSSLNIHFDYRVKGQWDYIYPMDSLGNIYGRFPYIATTRDSLALAQQEEFEYEEEIVLYFMGWMMERFDNPDLAHIIYGVYAVENDGELTYEEFEPGHTYYTAICGYDGGFEHATIYKFLWTGDSCNYYFRDTDDANIVRWIKYNN